MIVRTLAFCTPRRGAQRQALPVGRAADAVGEHHLADAVAGMVVEIVADQRQHHVKRGGAAGAGIDIAVDLEEGRKRPRSAEMLPGNRAGSPNGWRSACR